MLWMTTISKAANLEIRSGLKDQRGAVAIMVALLMTVFLGFGALAIDLSHLYVARNELQNAADAGALAGARFLYNDDGTEVNDDGFVDSDGNAHAGANQIAFDAATANESEKTAVDVNWTGGNEGDVQRGHWCFASRTFTANASTVAVDLWDVSSADLDNNPNFINAVKVVTRRQTTPIVSFFARIFGYPDFQLSTEAIAYLGFAGDLQPGDVDQPIAICKESLLNAEGEYDCSIGRMINSGQNEESSETGGWTSFSQDDPCTGGTNAQEVSSLVCGDGNPSGILLGQSMATNGGDIQSAFNDLYQCWVNNTSGRTRLWNLTLPVVDCPGNNVGTCEEVKGAVNLNIVWITGAGEDPGYNDAPTQMEGWSSSETNGADRWNSFVQYFSLQNVDGSPAPYAKKSIYFLPDCTVHDPKGGSGGQNFGILAKIPKLVK